MRVNELTIVFLQSLIFQCQAADATDKRSYVRERILKKSTAPSCTAAECGNDVVTTFGPFNCFQSPQLTLLDQYSYTKNNVTHELIKLYGPSDPVDAAALVISAPHGGDLKPQYIPDRTTDNSTYCPSGCKVLKDSYTLQIATKLTEKVMSNYCRVPYLIVNELHRSKLDANREQPEATFDHPVATAAWQKFHEFIHDAQNLVMNKFGTVTNAQDIAGIPGIMFDVHGYAGYDWDENGAPFTQWGYRLSKNTLDQNDHCPVDDDLSTSSTRGTFTHARQMLGQTLECLVRGPKSIGSRFNNQLPISGEPPLCGVGLPSFEYQDPKAIASDPNHCNDDDGVCHYYTGGFDLEVHERLDWENINGIHMNTVQAEFPRCIRFGNDDVHTDTANKLSIALCSFMHDLFGANLSTC